MKKSHIAAGAVWLVIFLLALLWRGQNLDAFGLSNDEGIHLMWAGLVTSGYTLYQEIYAVQPPLFINTIALAFDLAGQSVAVGRTAILLTFGALALLLSGLPARRWGWPGALSAMLLLALAPLLFEYSRLVMAETPATALALLSLALALRYVSRPQPRRGWLAASGLALGASFLFKALYPFVALPVGLLLALYHRADLSPAPPAKPPLYVVAVGRALLSPRKKWGPLLADGLLWGGAALLPVALLFVWYDAAAVTDQLVTFRADLRAAIPGSWAATWQQARLFGVSHWGFWLPAFGGIILTITRRAALPPSGVLLLDGPLPDVIWLTWLLGGSGLLLWHTPLFSHHFITLLPPLIGLGAAFLAYTVQLWRMPAPLPTRLAATALLIVALLSLPDVIRANQAHAEITTGGREQEALRLLQAVSQPTDFLMGDSQLLIFMAGRQTPPPLGDLALVGIKAGRQTSERLMELTQTYQAPALVQWSLRLPWLPEYLAWAEHHFLARRVWDNDHIIYFVPRLPSEQPPPNNRNTELAEGVSLRGYQTEIDAPTTPDRALHLKTYWQLAAPLDHDYTIFTQLLDSSGTLVAGYDSQPLEGYFPTGQWPAGEIITNYVRLPLPADLPPGRYTLVTGMYRLDTLERLPVANRSTNDVLLTQIDVE